MTRIRTTMMALATLGLFGRGAIACAASESNAALTPAEPPDASSDSATEEAGRELEPPDAADAAIDADKLCTDQGWCHTKLPVVPDGDGGLVAPPKGLSLVDVWAAPNHEAWAVTAQGYLLHWTGEWRVAFDAKTPLRTVWGSSDSEIWIAGEDHYVAHGTSKGGGILFESLDLGADEDILRFRSTSSMDVWAITAHRIFRYTGNHDTNGKPMFTPSEFPNGIEAPSRNKITSMYQRDSQVWITGFETTDCSDNGKECCFSDNGCPVNFVAARFRGDKTPPADTGSLDAWERVVMESERLIALRGGTLSSDGVHTLFTVAYPGISTWITRMGKANDHLFDAGAAMPAGDYVWTLDEQPAYGSTPEGLWSSSSDDVWMIATPGIVRRWDGVKWNVAHVSITSSPLIAPLHAIDGNVTSTEHELWVVGENIALHQVVAR
ncbi:hypothetical protein AKJ09_01487 [Labilithrix luteola]|uniref:Type IV fimbrial biogenesis protein PilY1 n=1 Tax=Labilithrix luteola TaxID=1391654 RepID=A0A0K1PMS2_9BACT|nr:hypothetical protein [Labilithrix luteola]AKU94823.1 hypothetical protein AKJ09_01487 [Labilithrix luteola]